MHLFGRHERPRAYSVSQPHLVMKFVEPPKCLRLVSLHIDAESTLREAMPNPSQCGQLQELLGRQIQRAG